MWEVLENKDVLENITTSTKKEVPSYTPYISTQEEAKDDLPDLDAAYEENDEQEINEKWGDKIIKKIKDDFINKTNKYIFWWEKLPVKSEDLIQYPKPNLDVNLNNLVKVKQFPDWNFLVRLPNNDKYWNDDKFCEWLMNSKWELIVDPIFGISRIEENWGQYLLNWMNGSVLLWSDLKVRMYFDGVIVKWERVGETTIPDLPKSKSWYPFFYAYVLVGDKNKNGWQIPLPTTQEEYDVWNQRDKENFTKRLNNIKKQERESGLRR